MEKYRCNNNSWPFSGRFSLSLLLFLFIPLPLFPPPLSLSLSLSLWQKHLLNVKDIIPFGAVSGSFNTSAFICLKGWGGLTQKGCKIYLSIYIYIYGEKERSIWTPLPPPPPPPCGWHILQKWGGPSQRVTLNWPRWVDRVEILELWHLIGRNMIMFRLDNTTEKRSARELSALISFLPANWI